MIFSKLPSLLLLIVILFSSGACSLINSDEEKPEQFEAEVSELVAPSEAKVNVPVEIQLNGNTGCMELARVEKKITSNQVIFQVWKHEKDNTCGVIPAPFSLKETVIFPSTGEYQVVAGDRQQTVIIN